MYHPQQARPARKANSFSAVAAGEHILDRFHEPSTQVDWLSYATGTSPHSTMQSQTYI